MKQANRIIPDRYRCYRCADGSAATQLCKEPVGLRAGVSCDATRINYFAHGRHHPMPPPFHS